MALVTRLSRLFQADFHAVLDRIEEPDLQLGQAVREMQFALDHDSQRLQLVRHEVEQLGKQLLGTGGRLKALDEELDICLAAKQDELARDLVRRKLVAEIQQQRTRERIETLESQSQVLTRQIDEQGQQLASMKQKLELLVSSRDPAAVASCPGEDVIRSEEIEIALLREKQRRAKS
jgi:phage shock protein A